jgi:hypothetical protein
MRDVDIQKAEVAQSLFAAYIAHRKTNPPQMHSGLSAEGSNTLVVESSNTLVAESSNTLVADLALLQL